MEWVFPEKGKLHPVCFGFIFGSKAFNVLIHNHYTQTFLPNLNSDVLLLTPYSG